MKAVAGILALSAATVLVAEGLGLRGEVYSGALGGALLGLVGWAFGLGIQARSRRAEAPSSGRWDIWGLWGAGMLSRLVLLGFLAWGLWGLWGRGCLAALLTLAAVYVVLLFWEAHWLMRVLISDTPAKTDEASDG